MMRQRRCLSATCRSLLLLLMSMPLLAAEDTDTAMPVMEEGGVIKSTPEPDAKLQPEPSTEPDSMQTEPVPLDPADATGLPATGAPAAGMPATGLPPFPPRSQFDEMLERPLFHSSRRPQADEPSGGSAQELRETWKLTGIVLVGDELRALFSERNGERRLRLSTGMPLDASWVLDEINREAVVMGSGDEQVTLELMEPRDTTPVVVPETAEGENGDAAPLDERTREASRQLEQDTESVKETLNE